MKFMVAVVLAGLVLGHGDHGDGDHAGPTSVFVKFPTEPSFYSEEVAGLLEDGVVERYGEEEFASVVLSHEIHQHIGLYTIVGAKMGVRALELLEAPRRSVEVTVETLPGTPLACATDGIQASMGSTYGQGLIAIVPAVEKKLECTFEYGGKTLRMKLKPAYAEEIQGIIARESKAHGFLSAAYFEGIRKACYGLWGEWDRTEIFEEAMVEE